MIEVGAVGRSRNCFMNSNLATVEVKNMDGSTLFKLRKIGRKKRGFSDWFCGKNFRLDFFFLCNKAHVIKLFCNCFKAL